MDVSNYCYLSCSLPNGCALGEPYAKNNTVNAYETAPRANVFRRDNYKVSSLKGIKDLLRYNNFEHDPLAMVRLTRFCCNVRSNIEFRATLLTNCALDLIWCLTAKGKLTRAQKSIWNLRHPSERASASVVLILRSLTIPSLRTWCLRLKAVLPTINRYVISSSTLTSTLNRQIFTACVQMERCWYLQ